MHGGGASSDDQEGAAASNLLSRAAEVAVAATDALKGAADELEGQHRSEREKCLTKMRAAPAGFSDERLGELLGRSRSAWLAELKSSLSMRKASPRLWTRMPAGSRLSRWFVWRDTLLSWLP